MVLWEHPAERYIALVSLVLIAISLSVIAVKRLTEPSPLILQVPTQPNQRTQLTKPSLKVHVKGAVQKPGVYALPYGSRVQDALRLAGTKPDADLDALNLADFLEDGQEIIVPGKGRQTALPNPSSLVLAPPSNTTAAHHEPRAKASPKVVHLNTATEADLVQLPGIGPALAKRILEHRRQVGGFKRIEQLLEVKGIGPKKLEQIRPYVRL